MPRDWTGSGRRPEFVDGLTEICLAELSGLGVDPERAAEAAVAIVQQVCSRFGKSQLYIPEHRAPELRQRDSRLYAAYQMDSQRARRYTSARVDELGAEYGLSAPYVYQIIQAQRAAERASRQPMLPGLEADPAPSDQPAG
jgi:Mor family transcriptional regulator